MEEAEEKERKKYGARIISTQNVIHHKRYRTDKDTHIKSPHALRRKSMDDIVIQGSATHSLSPLCV